MGNWPVLGPVNPSIISAYFHPEIYGNTGAASASLTMVTANNAFYYPYILHEPVTVTKAWWQNGSAATGTVSFAIYDSEGNQYTTTGSQSQTGASTVQSVDITDTWIPSGLIYLGVSASSGSSSFWASAAIQGGGTPTYSIYLQTTAHPLPNPAVFAVTGAATTGIFKFGWLISPRTVL